MRLIPTLALVMTLLAGGFVGDAFARDRDRDRDQKQERQERRYDERRHEERGRGESRRDEGRYFGEREASLVDRRSSSSEGRSSSRMTAAQAARQAQQRYGGGRVLSVDSMGDGFRVKLLRDGDVRVVFISDR